MLELAGDKPVIEIYRVVLAAGSSDHRENACSIAKNQLAAALNLRTSSLHGADRDKRQLVAAAR